MNINKKEKLIGSAAILIIISVVLFFGYQFSKQKSYGNVPSNNADMYTDDSASDNKQKESAVSEDKDIKVEIKGEVKHPDVYTLKKGSIVQDLIKVSGGFNSEADTDNVIQSAKLNDGDCVRVAKKTQGGNSEQVVSGIVHPSSNGESGEKVNINTATKEELQKVSGIGQTKAQKIFDYREKNGPYKSVEDLKKIGARIGDTTLKNIKDKIDVK